MKKFTGHEYDEETDLTYANARYYNQNQGQFLSQDPASRDNPNRFLMDPQLLNSYSYTGNNPLKYIDPNGKERSYPSFQGQLFQAMRFDSGLNRNQLNRQFQQDVKDVSVTTMALTAEASLYFVAPELSLIRLGKYAYPAAGATVNVINTYQDDIKDGSVDYSGRDYVTSAVIGGVEGQLLKGASLMTVFGVSTAGSIAEQSLLNGNVNYGDAVIDGATNTGASYLFGTQGVSNIFQTTPSFFGEMAEGRAAYGAGAVLKNLTNKKDE